MELPAHPAGGVQVGISDVLAWRDCAMRAKFGRRRLVGQEAPESWSPANAYGSAVHDAIAALDDGTELAVAINRAFARFKQWLEPSDLSRIAADLMQYQAREVLGVRTLLNESEIAIPLFEHPAAGQVWFRARIDRLYQTLDDSGLLLHYDWKSSKWPKSYEEVGKDLQLWAYNLAIVEWFCDLYPEVEDVRLVQTYDQLNYGQIPTQKSAPQREQIRTWLITAITAMIADTEEAPTFNEWCPWCPLKWECPVVEYQLTDWALTKIAALMPREEKLNKDGSVSKRRGKVVLDAGRIAEYVELLDDVHRAGQTLESFETEVRDTLKRMPDTELAALGRKKVERSRRVFSAEAKRAVIDDIGLARALMIFELSISGIERFFGEGSPEATRLTGLAEKEHSYTAIADL